MGLAHAGQVSGVLYPSSGSRRGTSTSGRRRVPFLSLPFLFSSLPCSASGAHLLVVKRTETFLVPFVPHPPQAGKEEVDERACRVQRWQHCGPAVFPNRPFRLQSAALLCP